jgi:lysylphosphatidylglycerol synthetase-like protein (DUF2156 family)
MKKIIIFKILILCIFWSINIANANDSTTSSDTVTVYVTEKVPWAGCSKDDEKSKNGTTIYKCEIAKWAEQIVSTLWSIIKYFTYIASLVWVLFIVFNGIMYSMWWADQSLKDEAKKRIIWTLLWLTVLLLSGPILQLIAPWIYK